MALNAVGYTGGAAGTAADSNRQWLLASGNDANGNQYLTNGQSGANLRYAYYLSGGWYIGPTLLSGSGAYQEYYYNAGQPSASTFPLSNWVVGSGASPAPTFTANAAAAPDAAAVRLAAAASGASVISLADLSTTRAGSLSTSADRILLPGQYADTSAARLAARSAGAASALLSDASPARSAGRVLSGDALRLQDAAPVQAAARSQSAEGITLPPSFYDAATARTGARSGPARIALLLSDASRAGAGCQATGHEALSLSVSGSVAVAARQLAAASLFIPSALNVYDTIAGDPFAALRLFGRNWAFLKGPLVIPPQRLLPILDAEGASVRTADFQLAANTLAGVPLLITGGDGVTSTVYGSGDESFINDMGPVTDAQVAQSSPLARLAAFYAPWMSKLGNHLAKAGAGIPAGSPPAPAFGNLDQYASYQNGLTRYSFLVSPGVALLQWLYNGQQGALLMQPGNVFAPATALGTATVGAAAGAVAFAPGSVIPTVNAPASGQQGYTPAKGAAASVTAPVNGTLTAAFTANGWDANGNVVTGRTWTATLSGLAAGQSVNLAPAVAGDRISAIVSAAGSGTATAGAFSLMSLTER